jgi:hypothetical protein
MKRTKYNTVWPESEAEICPQVAARIRSGIRQLDDLNSMLADYWAMELHEVDGYPIPHRWNSGNLALIERDVMQQLSL